MTLYEGRVGGQYLVEDIKIESEISRRLQALGLIEGTRLKMLNRKGNGSLIIYVRGTRLALIILTILPPSGLRLPAESPSIPVNSSPRVISSPI